MSTQFDRTIKIIGETAQNNLHNKKVAVFGLGGVGSYTVEALVRAGIGSLVLIDFDTIDLTNINRQLYALHSTIGKKKIDVAKERCLDINPNLKIETYDELYLPDKTHDYLFKDVDYVIDCIDNVSGKIGLIEECHQDNIRIISCMGTGNKLDPSLLEITTIDKTSICPLARVMRKKLKEKGLNKTMVLYSKEQPISINDRTPGSISYVPSSAGLLIASKVINELMEEK
ncbi:MAG: tRNA threonylcarbamoyladenosine dehydratase [Thomasclavelia sp.]|jgi:tRNA A37 threonylcarbamoyladenosine dehydratase|nr:tRNA threonylcarbamoyladenosine dehydratase [Thomasclavelia sp.]